jgi:hypothetical protein
MDPETFVRNDSCAPCSVERPEVRKIKRGDGEASRRGMNVAVKTWVLETLTEYALSKTSRAMVGSPPSLWLNDSKLAPAVPVNSNQVLLVSQRTSVVDKNVDPAKLGLHSPKESVDSPVVGNVNLHNIDAALSVRKLLGELSDCFITIGRVAAAKKNMVGLRRAKEGLDGFEADARVCAGDENDFFVFSHDGQVGELGVDGIGIESREGLPFICMASFCVTVSLLQV